jgi:LmbE family N-acetylglucosaminyl deacetylase
MHTNKVNILAFGAHPDNVESRKDESEAAANIMGVEYREQLNLPDGGKENNEATRLLAIALIRKYQPEPWRPQAAYH